MSEKRCGEIIKQTRRRGELKSHAKFRSPPAPCLKTVTQDTLRSREK
ncbi:MAG: hypothetical protein F6K58_08225 [Symploca sp. SIO2E9]|nr:hypothetical protein [Symploca sp. SIO2E9]